MEKIEYASFFDKVKIIKKFTNQSNCEQVLRILIQGFAPNSIKYVCRRFRINKNNPKFINLSLRYESLDLPIWLAKKGFAMSFASYYYACGLKRINGDLIFEDDEKRILPLVFEKCEWLKEMGVNWDSKIYRALINLRLYRIAPFFIRKVKRAFYEACRNNNLKLMKEINKHHDLGPLRENPKYMKCCDENCKKWLKYHGFN